jgi:hypothetical protein
VIPKAFSLRQAADAGGVESGKLLSAMAGYIESRLAQSLREKSAQFLDVSQLGIQFLRSTNVFGS